MASKIGNHEAVKLLLISGAKPGSRIKGQYSAIDVAYDDSIYEILAKAQMANAFRIPYHANFFQDFPPNQWPEY